MKRKKNIYKKMERSEIQDSGVRSGTFKLNPSLYLYRVQQKYFPHSK